MIKDDTKLVIEIEGTILSHSYNRIQRHFNQALTPKIQEVVFDITHANLHTAEILDFDWITIHAKRGVKITILYKEKMKENLQNLIRLNPEIAEFNQQAA